MRRYDRYPDARVSRARGFTDRAVEWASLNSNRRKTKFYYRDPNIPGALRFQLKSKGPLPFDGVPSEIGWTQCRSGYARNERLGLDP
jgi:hypothetical protein